MSLSSLFDMYNKHIKVESELKGAMYITSLQCEIAGCFYNWKTGERNPLFTWKRQEVTIKTGQYCVQTVLFLSRIVPQWCQQYVSQPLSLCHTISDHALRGDIIVGIIIFPSQLLSPSTSRYRDSPPHILLSWKQQSAVSLCEPLHQQLKIYCLRLLRFLFKGSSLPYDLLGAFWPFFFFQRPRVKKTKIKYFVSNHCERANHGKNRYISVYSCPCSECLWKT